MVWTTGGTLLVLFLTLGAPGSGQKAKTLQKPPNGKQTSADEALRDDWEPSIHLDGRPVDRFFSSSSKPGRLNRFGKASKGGRPHLPDALDPEWVNLDGFAVLGSAPARNSTAAGVVRSSPTRTRNYSAAERTAWFEKTDHPRRGSNAAAQRRAPQSSSGPRQPERAATGSLITDRRLQHKIKPQADQRNQHKAKLTSESVHVVSLQAQMAQGQGAPPKRTVPTKAPTSEPPIHEARDINVRVMSPKSVLISWTDPGVEMGKVAPEASRSYTVRFREKGESARWEYKESLQRRVMIDTLSADGMYEFSVRISGGGKHGEWSASVFQRTPESAPSGPPENFEVEPLRGKGTVVSATWDMPDEPNGRIREYILSYAPATKPFGMKTLTYSGSTTKAAIDGLTPGERYIFKIRATNRRGMGPQTKAFSVVMPQSSSGAATSSKTKGSERDADTAEVSNSRSTQEPKTAATTAQPRPAAAAVNRRLRPLSQTRSYHSIFSSLRGSIRNVVNRGSDREKAGDEEKEEELKTTTTPPPVKETTTLLPVVTTKEPDNNIPPISEEELDFEKEHKSTQAPSLKVFTLSPTKAAPVKAKRPGRRPVKIRVHQKTGSKIISASSPKGSSETSLTASPAATSLPFVPNSSSKSTSLSPSKHDQAPVATQKDHIASMNPDSESIYIKPTLTKSNPSSGVINGFNSQKRDTFTAGRDTLAGRGGISGIGMRFGRKHPRTLSKSNSTIMSGGYKPALGTRLNLPRTTSVRNTDSQKAAGSFPVIKAQFTSGSQLDSTRSQRENLNSAALDSRDTHKTPGQDTAYTEGAYDVSYNKENDPEGEEAAGGKWVQESGRGESSRNEKQVRTQPRSNPSFAERVPWLASRYPGRFGGSSARQNTLTRVSSSVGAGRPIIRTPTRATAAADSTLSSSIQETREDLRTPLSHEPPRNGVGSSSSRSPSTDQNVIASDLRKPLPSASSKLNSDSHQVFGSRHPVRKEHTDERKDNGISDRVSERSRESLGNDVTESHDSRAVTPDAESNAENKESTGGRETLSRTKPGVSSGIIHGLRRPGMGLNGRTRSSLSNNRQFGGSRLHLRPHTTHKVDSLPSESSLSSPDLSVSSNLPLPDLTSDTNVGRPNIVTKTGGISGSSPQPMRPSSSRDGLRNPGGRPFFPMSRRKPNAGRGLKPISGNGKNEQPNLTASEDKDVSSDGTGKAVNQKFITGPDGTKWMVDFDRGVLMNQDGQILQDSEGKPKRVVLGEDGRTIFDHLGSPLVSKDGLALFGHGRDSQPVVNPKDKLLTVGGKPVLGLDVVHPRPSRTFVTTSAPPVPADPTTVDWSSEEFPTRLPFPTCPPGTFSKLDEFGDPLLDPEGVLDCYPEEDSSGMEMDNWVPDALAFEKDEMFVETTRPPTTTRTTTEILVPEPNTRPVNRGPSSELDLSGKKRFTAPYVNYIQKDPSAPCSLTEALEFLQVDVLEDLMKKDQQAANQKEPPKNKPHNLTVVAMEGCHSFIILDWALPMKGDLVSGYMVHSASYDDVLNNRWSSRLSNGTHLAVENLKPNSRYYFKVQAKNVFGLGPVSDTLTYVTESDDPLLIERPPGGEPIWIPFTFKYNPAHSSCRGSQFVKRTWYRKFVGVVLCNSLRYKIFMGDGLREPFHSIGDTVGEGEDHCQFVDSYRDGRTGPVPYPSRLVSVPGYYRAYRQEPVSFGNIGQHTAHSIVGWYECGVPIPGKW